MIFFLPLLISPLLFLPFTESQSALACAQIVLYNNPSEKLQHLVFSFDTSLVQPLAARLELGVASPVGFSPAMASEIRGTVDVTIIMALL